MKVLISNPIRFRKLVASQFVWLAAFFPSFSADTDTFVPPVESLEGYHHFLHEIPAPRGLIIDRSGKPLAQNVARKRIVLNLKQVASTLGASPSKEAVTEEALEVIESLVPLCSSIDAPSRKEIERHWDPPPPISRWLFPVLSIQMTSIAFAVRWRDFYTGVRFQDVYQRRYPENEYLPTSLDSRERPRPTSMDH